jgi:hypothetical protein
MPSDSDAHTGALYYKNAQTPVLWMRSDDGRSLAEDLAFRDARSMPPLQLTRLPGATLVPMPDEYAGQPAATSSMGPVSCLCCRCCALTAAHVLRCQWSSRAWHLLLGHHAITSSLLVRSQRCWSCAISDGMPHSDNALLLLLLLQAFDLSIKPDIACPGSLYSSLPNETYQTWPGTSMSSPYMAGVLALWKQRVHNLRGRDNPPAGGWINAAFTTFKNTAKPIKYGDTHLVWPPAKVGAGMVQAFSAVVTNVTLTPPELLMRTNGSHQQFTLSVTNAGSSDMSYTLGHQPAVTLSLDRSWYNKAYDVAAPTAVATGVERVIKVAARSTRTVKVGRMHTANPDDEWKSTVLPQTVPTVCNVCIQLAGRIALVFSAHWSTRSSNGRSRACCSDCIVLWMVQFSFSTCDLVVGTCDNICLQVGIAIPPELTALTSWIVQCCSSICSLKDMFMTCWYMLLPAGWHCHPTRAQSPGCDLQRLHNPNTCRSISNTAPTKASHNFKPHHPVSPIPRHQQGLLNSWQT